MTFHYVLVPDILNKLITRKTGTRKYMSSSKLWLAECLHLVEEQNVRRGLLFELASPLCVYTNYILFETLGAVGQCLRDI